MKKSLSAALLLLALVGCSSLWGGISRMSPQDQDQKKQLPGPEEATETAPDTYQVEFETTKGNFVVEVNREWSPNGADRFYNLVKIGYFQDIAIFRAIKDFMIQFGIHGDPAVNKVWSEAKIKDDASGKASNEPGMITFARTGAPDSRSVQFFINLGDNARLDNSGFTPFGKVVSGMDIVTQINTEYDENSREVQGRFQAEGNEFIRKKYPNLDYIKSIKLITKE